ncbi:winged helix-turn-helix domain-containing protein [Amycolatopsis nigrescens]|uniref:winged helix-turn-helix domain-containing protein n=1 Tax=Amycolatopsis nigrescens TaxID=381445 RepID=UPI001FE1C481|nr:winged helix-turn-helix domain-containing protein [Amycolatopsis nigrescens]
MTDSTPRRASDADLRALSHPLSWRILRLCLDSACTNQQLARRLGVSPATVLRRVRALADAGFLAAEPPRQGDHGAWERPYRATGRTWRLDLGHAGEPVLTAQVELATVDAHRAELLSGGPGAVRRTGRGVLRLSERSEAELNERLDALIDEFLARSEPGGRRLSYLWSLIEQPGAAD